MAEGSMNSEVPNRESKWAKLKNLLFKRGGKQSVAVSTPPESSVQEADNEEEKLPEDYTELEGYSKLVEKFKAGNNERAAQELILLYPEMAALLKKPTEERASLQVNKTWSVAMTDDERNLISAALKAGNPKTIAVLAYYVFEKASGDLPLQISVKNPQVSAKETRSITSFYGQKARDLQKDMENYVRKIESTAFNTELVRTKWEEISIPVLNYDKEAGEMQSSTVQQNPAQSPSIQK